MALFEWDANKNAINKKKHGISFQQSTEVFNDANAVTVEDKRHDYGETRNNTTGFAFGKLWSVIWTPRKEKKRLISSRRANKKENRRYSSMNAEGNA